MTDCNEHEILYHSLQISPHSCILGLYTGIQAPEGNQWNKEGSDFLQSAEVVVRAVPSRCQATVICEWCQTPPRIPGTHPDQTAWSCEDHVWIRIFVGRRFA